MLKVGLILYSVRDEMAKDPLATVKKVGELGYKYVEVCNHNAAADPGCGFGIGAEELKAEFDRFGTKAISAHIFPIEGADLTKVVAYEKILGNTNIVNPMARFSSYDDMMRQIEGFNESGKKLKEMGMNYLYHNHNHEFRTYKGKSIMDYIVENTDPAYVSLELDTFWAMRGGKDPIEILKKYGDRIKLVHQKDFARDAICPINLNGLTPEDWELEEGEIFTPNGRVVERTTEPTPEEQAEMEAQQIARTSAFAEIGKGIMPIQQIIDTADQFTKAEYIILEQDYTRMASQIDSVAVSMESFKKFNNISWEA